MSKKPSPNDQRSDVKNPNNPAYVADRDNRQSLGQEHVLPSPKPELQQPAPPKK
jgi:hypothetical protein